MPQRYWMLMLAAWHCWHQLAVTKWKTSIPGAYLEVLVEVFLRVVFSFTHENEDELPDDPAIILRLGFDTTTSDFTCVSGRPISSYSKRPLDAAAAMDTIINRTKAPAPLTKTDLSVSTVSSCRSAKRFNRSRLVPLRDGSLFICSLLERVDRSMIARLFWLEMREHGKALDGWTATTKMTIVAMAAGTTNDRSDFMVDSPEWYSFEPL